MNCNCTSSCDCNCNSSYSCGCCEGVETLTPMAISNQPGLNALTYRVGTHATFLESMKARLSDSGFPSLKDLKTRDSKDPSIALLDAWATVADVLTFYQERIANEGYLRTATEHRSVQELACLAGYAPSLGVSASVYLAFTLEDGYNVEIPVGTRAQSLPSSGELPQSFETSEKLSARAELNSLKPRTSQPQRITLNKANPDANPDSTDATQIDKLYLQGIGTNLKQNDLLLLIFGDKENEQILRRVRTVEPQPVDDRTQVILQTPVSTPQESTPSETVAPATLGTLGTLGTQTTQSTQIARLLKSPSQQPANALELVRTTQQIFHPERSDLNSRLIKTLEPRTNKAIDRILTDLSPPPQLERIEALSIKAAPFGHNVPLRQVTKDGTVDFEEWPLAGSLSPEPRKILVLDAQYDQIVPGSWIVLERIKRINDENQTGIYIYKVEKVENVSKTDYGTVARVTQLTLNEPWLAEEDTSLEVVRNTTVYIPSEVLTLTQQPIDKDVPYANATGNDKIELDGLYEGLQPGRWLIIDGERSDLPGLKGVRASEVVMLAGVRQNVCKDLPDDLPHTFLQFARPLTYAYKRETLTIYGNVVKATHGETRTEVLGSGDGSQAFQQFKLAQPPLTYLPAPTPSGVASTLEVYVNDVRWHEAESLLQLSPTDHCFVTRTDREGNTTIIFGNGENGARLPSGIENVRAVYRTGIGKAGNVAAEQINQLAMQPLGLKGVLNPLPATGGADPESVDRARRHAPLGMVSLGRAVSVQDYADFARTFTGISKASAVSLSDGNRQIVHLTIAGADDIPIDKDSDLYRSFLKALHQFGDPYLPIQVDIRELMLLIVSAKVRILSDYQWTSVAPMIRTALSDAFSFERRLLGQDVVLSEVISIIQQVPGVNYVDVDILDCASEAEAKNPDILNDKLKGLAGVDTRWVGEQPLQPKQRITVNLAQVEPMASDRSRRLRPAQLAILSPEVADTLILKELKS